jgi:hypothetical protein
LRLTVFRLKFGDLTLRIDQFQLERLVRQFALGLPDRVEAAALEGLALLDDLLGPSLDLGKVLRMERLGHLEVVEEAVLDGRADAQLGLGEHVLHGLRDDMRGRVAQHVEPVRAVDRDRSDRRVGLGRPVEVPQVALPVAHDDDRLGAAHRQTGFGHRGARRRTGGHGDGVDCAHVCSSRQKGPDIPTLEPCYRHPRPADPGAPVSPTIPEPGPP